MAVNTRTYKHSQVVVEFLMHSQMAYYKLYGRPSSGSNVRVRLADKNLSGLGVEVCI